MAEAPLISTIVALALIPVAFLFTHAFLSGRKGWGFHTITGGVGVVWDLSLSMFYMIYRLFGGDAEGGVLDITPEMTAYFAVHGIIAVVVIVLELAMLMTGVMQLRSGSRSEWHSKLSAPLYGFWFAAFLSGELVYLVYYVL